MMRRCILILLLLPLLACAKSILDSPQLSTNIDRLSLDGKFKYFVDKDSSLSFEDIARQDFVASNFLPLASSKSLGYDTDAHWFYTEIKANMDAPRRWVLAVGSPELEDVDVWVGRQTGGFQHYALGYHQPYENRPLQARLFAVPIEVFSGMQIYLRIKTSNALNVHASLWQVNAFTAYETQDNFYRGAYFGILLIVIVFYLIFGLFSKDSILLAYAGYILSQWLFHLGTNGYIPVLLGEDGTWASDALPRVGWLGGAACIAFMWDRLLALKNNYIWLHRCYLLGIIFSLMFLPFALIPSMVGEWILYFVKLENLLNAFIFLNSIVLLLVYWRRDKKNEWLIYFIAFAIPAIATVVNTALNQGGLPWNFLTKEFYQAATLVHIAVMSYGLALRLRQMQRDKQRVEREVELATQRTEEQRRFVAMLSHEFGNPLAAIDRAAQMVQIKAQDLPLSERQRLHQIRNNAATLAGFVSNFLATEALDHNAVTLACTPCAVDMLLEQCLQQLDDGARQRLRITASPPNASFTLDASLIQAALGNLIANALRYSPPASEVDVKAVQSTAGLRIAVTDRGSGVSQTELEALGKPYFRATSSQGQAGSGLGYYFSQRIVEAHGGTLTASLPPQGGLKVEMFLPGPISK